MTMCCQHTHVQGHWVIVNNMNVAGAARLGLARCLKVMIWFTRSQMKLKEFRQQDQNANRLTHLSLSYQAHSMKICSNSTKDDTLTNTILYYTIFHV